MSEYHGSETMKPRPSGTNKGDVAGSGRVFDEEDKKAFETERQHIIHEIAQGLSDATTQIRSINRNLEHLNEVGKGFEKSANLWADFCHELEQQQQ